MLPLVDRVPINAKECSAMLQKLCLAGLLFLAGCAPTQPDTTLKVSHPVSPGAPGAGPKFRIERVGVFGDALAWRGLRGIYVLTDTTTGKQWVGVSGIGITEVIGNSRSKSGEQ
jgi:hypothetical protein